MERITPSPKRICPWNLTHEQPLIMGDLDPALYAADSHGICQGCKKIVMES